MINFRAITGILALGLIALLQISCSSERASFTHLGELNNGKADVLSLDFDLPCLEARGSASDSASFSFSASGPFVISLSQPSVPSSQRAYARLHLDHGDDIASSPSSRSPELTWTPVDQEVVSYSLTVANRSTSRTLCAHLSIEALIKFAPPQQRRTFSSSLSFDPGLSATTVAFFDADCTLRTSKSGSKTPDTPEDVMLLPGVAKKIIQAAAAGELIVIVSNQGGVSYGYLTLEQAEAALAKTAQLLADRGAPVHYLDFATHYDNDRKPKTGMATRLEQLLQSSFGLALDWQKSYMVGDAGWKKDKDTEPDGTPGEDFSNSDRLFAEALGIPFHHPRDFFGWIEHGVRNFHSPQEVADFLLAHPEFDEVP